MSLIDSHCHLDDEQFKDDRDAVIDRALAGGIERLLAIGTGHGPPDLSCALRIAHQHEQVYATVGIHPEHAPNATPESYRELESLLADPKCLALGEIGLDYYWKPFDRDLQHSVFIEQLGIARAAGRPVVIHTRDAWEDTMNILREHWSPSGLPCVMHCFTGGPAEAAQALEAGFYISVAGVVTYPKAVDLREAVRTIPSDRLLVETDAPYLAPVPHRGKRNEPAFVMHTSERVAEIRGEAPARFAQAVRANFEAIFRKQ